MIRCVILCITCAVASPAIAQWCPVVIHRTADGREYWQQESGEWTEIHRTQCGGGSCPQPQYYQQPQQQQRPIVMAPVAPPYRPIPNASNGIALLSWRDQIEKRLNAQDARIAALASAGAGKPGPQGPPGPPGPPGPAGAGIDANALAIQITQAVNAQVEQRISAVEAAQNKPFHLRVSPDSPYQAVRPGNYVTLPLERLQTQ
jgi:hypothetical protein